MQELIGSYLGMSIKFIGYKESLPRGGNLGDCCICNSQTYIYDNKSWIMIANDPWYVDRKKEQFKKHHHRFNCKYCGAPGQIDVCSYCGNVDKI